MIRAGGSTPKALSLYGVKPESYSGDQQMFDLMHAMRTRIMTSPAFNGDRILGVIAQAPTTSGPSSRSFRS